MTPKSSTRCRLIVSAAAGLLTSLLPQLAHASRIWYEQGVATVTVGYDSKSRQYTHRKFYVAAYGPESLPGSAHDAARSCTSKVTTAVGEETRVALWKVKEPKPPTGLTSADEQTRLKNAAARDAAVDNLVNTSIRSFRQKLQACGGKTFDASEFELALIHRVCDTRTNSCSSAPVAYADHPAAQAFAVMSLWIDARNGNHPTLPPNSPILLPDLVDARTTFKQLDIKTPAAALKKCREEADAKSAPTAKRPLTCLALEMASRDFKESNVWPDAPEGTRAQVELERLVVQARAASKRIDKSAPRLAAVPKEIAIRMVDVLDEPQEALAELKSDANVKLLTIQDELARTRIAECVRFRGQKTPAEVAACAGYSVDVATINQCLSGAACVPKLGDKGWAAVLAQTNVGSLKDVALSSLSPRSAAQLQQLESAAKECAKKGSRQAAAACALEQQLGDKEKKAWACVKGKSASQLDAKSVECALGGSLPPEATKAVDCTKKFAKTGDQAQCALTASLPSPAGDLLSCQKKYSNDDKKAAQCMAEAVGGTAGDVAKAATCLQNGGDDWAKTAMCVAGNKVPKQVGDVIDCAQNSSGAAAVGGCLALKNVPDQYRKPAQCIAESGGDPFGAGVCMVSDGLTPDQRIALQCLASTGGEPVSFVTCSGGRLFVKEMFNCVDKKLFEDKCMGEGNDIRKFMKALGVDLKPTTVVGQVLNAPLDVVKFQVAAAQAALQGLENFGNNVSREVGNALQEGQRIGDQAKKDANNGVEWVEGRTGVRLPFRF
jgi:hypothetical protein